MGPANLQAQWADLLLASLVEAGVRDVVVSPGSRSTPFVLAAAAMPDLTLHDVVDERVAAFFALGLARAHGRPPLLLCTSGTAGAHYLPAIIEASLAGLPLLVLTADRPFELMGCAAPQTIDQTRLFGTHVRRFVELGLPDDHPAALRALRRQAAQAVAETRWPEPGVVHLNARARKPLEPPRELDDAGRALAARVRDERAGPLPRAAAPRLVPDEDAVEVVVDALASARRPLLVCGPVACPPTVDWAVQARTFAWHHGVPIVAETASGLRARTDDGGPLLVDAYDAIYRSPRLRAELAPDVILQLGPPPTSGAWGELVAAAGARRFVVWPRGWNDPQSDAELLLWADVREAVEAIDRRLTERTGRAVAGRTAAWRERLAAVNDQAWRIVDATLAAATGGLAEGEVARRVVAAAPAGSLLALGNSLPIRLVETFVPAPDRPLVAFVQRGAAGIDGLVAGAAGAAVGWDAPMTLLVGDVSLLHDLGGLAVAATAPGPLVIVVLHNDGGRIFEQLPVAADPSLAGHLPHFTTPHGRSFAAAAAFHGLRHALVTTARELDAALATAHARDGATLVEVRVPPHGAAAVHRDLARRLEALA